MYVCSFEYAFSSCHDIFSSHVHSFTDTRREIERERERRERDLRERFEKEKTNLFRGTCVSVKNDLAWN